MILENGSGTCGTCLLEEGDGSVEALCEEASGSSEKEGVGVIRQPGKYLLEQQLEQPAQLEGGALYLYICIPSTLGNDGLSFGDHVVE